MLDAPVLVAACVTVLAVGWLAAVVGALLGVTLAVALPPQAAGSSPHPTLMARERTCVRSTRRSTGRICWAIIARGLLSIRLRQISPAGSWGPAPGAPA